MSKRTILVMEGVGIVLIIAVLYWFVIIRKESADLSFLNSSNFVSLLLQTDTITVEMDEYKTLEIESNEIKNLIRSNYEKWELCKKDIQDPSGAKVSLYIHKDPVLYITFFENDNVCKITDDKNERYYSISNEPSYFDEIKQILTQLND